MAKDEENPGPTEYDIIDPNRTVAADYCQGNSRFRQNAGKQETDVGYIHNLSPIKMARSSNGEIYYNFTLQTSPTNYKRCVGFDEKSHAQVLHYQTTGSPTKLVNIFERDDQLLINQSSSLASVSTSHVTFQKKEPTGSDAFSDSFSIAVDAALKDIPTFSKNQTVNVTGILTMGDSPPKKVTKRKGEISSVKEDCVIEDASGNVEINTWENASDCLVSGKACAVPNLAIKNFSGNTFLSTTSSSTLTEADLELDDVKRSKLLSGKQKEVAIKEFKFVGNVKIFTCQIKSWSKRMPYAAGSKVFKCQLCNTVQKVSLAKRGMSARLCAEIDGKEVWLTAMTDAMETLLCQTGLSIDSKTDDIAEALLGLEKVTSKIDLRSMFILK